MVCFRCTWSPLGITMYANSIVSGDALDWTYWYALDHRSGGWDSRPSNELLFIHDMDHALYTVLDRRSQLRSVQIRDHVLLQGVARLVDELKCRLDTNFEVTMLTDIFVEW